MVLRELPEVKAKAAAMPLSQRRRCMTAYTMTAPSKPRHKTKAKLAWI